VASREREASGRGRGPGRYRRYSRDSRITTPKGKNMLSPLRKLLYLSGIICLATCPAWAQTTTLEGAAKNQNGGPIKGATVVLNRTDMKGHYHVKTDKKGHWLYMGLPYGTYDVSLVIDGKTVDKVNNVHSKYGSPQEVDFDEKKAAQQQQATVQANAAGQLTPQQEKGMSAEQKKQFEEQLKKHEAAIAKNKALNDSYNAGINALKTADAAADKTQKAADYQQAVGDLNKAAQVDPTQVAIWSHLGDADYGLARTQAAPANAGTYSQALQSYQKALGMTTNPADQAALYINMANIYSAEKKPDQAKQALDKAAQLNPGAAKTVFFNMAANLVNSGHPEQALPLFQKVVQADPTDAEAWYQIGSLSMMQGTVDPKSGKQSYPAETGEALNKYLQLQPNGPHAQEAKAMLQAIGEKVQTNFKAPAAKHTRKR
ncbi:MAG: carboxypeptidase regulatory-like domain-containing protein, partial [Bryobacteraceae bacterium]